MSEKRLDSLISEYLTAQGYLQTVATFKNETSKKSPQQQKPRDIHTEFLEAFECGEGHAFFQLWKEHVPADVRSENVQCQHLECNVSAYFAVYPIRTGIGNREESMSEFRSYLDHRGSVISQNQDLAPYFALPYIPDPSKHPSFKNIFLVSWSDELRIHLVQFLKQTLPNESIPTLLSMYLSNKGPSGEMLPEHCVQRVKEVQDAYHTLCNIAMELVGALESSVAGKQITPDFISGICSRLFENRIHSVSNTPPRPSTSTLRASIISLRQSVGTSECISQDYPPLDFDKIKITFSSGSRSEQNLLLQALGWRLTRSLPGNHRDAILTSYVTNDVLGCGRGRGSIVSLMDVSDTYLSEQIVRFLNAFSSLTVGRSYLSESTPIVMSLLHLLYRENGNDTPTRRNALGAIQKLSLRRSISRLMIKHSIVKWIVEDVLSETESLSDYTLRYSLALLMNISLRTIGRSSCVAHSNTLLEALGGMLEHEEDEISEYVNGTLYSLFTSLHLQQEARQMGMGELLEEALQVAPAQRKMQLQYILQQLNQKNNREGKGEELEDSGDEGQEDDEDEESDPDMIEGDEGEVVVQNNEILMGENLLVKEYLAKTPLKKEVSLSTTVTNTTVTDSKITSKQSDYVTSSIPRQEETLPDSSVAAMRPVTPQSFRSQSSINTTSSMLTQQPLRQVYSASFIQD